VPRVIPQRLPPGATSIDRLRYVRRWAIVGALLAIPFWALVFVWVRSTAVVVLFAVVTALTALNIASLTRQIGRVERE
jgi:hypothetical protein